MTNSLFMRIRSRFPSDLSKVLIETAEGTTYSYGDADAASARIAGLLTALGAKKVIASRFRSINPPKPCSFISAVSAQVWSICR